MTTQTSVNNQFVNADLSVHRSNAGATVLTTVTNIDNSNVASRAYIKLSTGGASGGDPSISYSNSVANFSVGLDNSDSDAFVMSESASLGTTNVARCDVDGIWTYPLNACFSANANNAVVNNVTGSAAFYTMAFGTERFDIGADYNTGTYTFTCPVTGVYIFTAATRIRGKTVSGFTRCLIYVGATPIAQFTEAHADSNMDGAGNVSMVYYCTAGDTITAKVQASGEAGETDDFDGNTANSWFMGALVS